MYNIAIVDEINQKGIDLLDKNNNFNYEVIKDVSKDNLMNNVPL